MPDRINHLAVWVAAIVYFVFGWLWYTIFSAPWMAATGKTAAEAQGSVGLYVGSFVLGLILAYATAIALARRAEDQTAAQGVSFALFMGIALYATQTLNQTLYESRPIVLWAIDAGYVIVGFAMIGAIVGAWKKRTAATA
jgi:hypothetical protein